jgi:cytochrome c peroxidase
MRPHGAMLGVLAAACLCACSSDGTTPPVMAGAGMGGASGGGAGAGRGGTGAGGGGSGGAGADETPVVLGPAERAALLALSPEPLPMPPADPTNAYGDSAAAAAFGKKLFFTQLFAGRLLDGDNTGSEGTLGRKGDTGKVSCASCHVPADGFSDTRSPSRQISLASGWGRRRAPSLLDIGHAKILMWDGRHDALFNQVFGPFESPLEMNSSRLYVAQRIWAQHRAEYEAIFGAIPAPLDDPGRFPQLTAERTGCASLDAANRGVDCHGVPGDKAEYDGLSPADRDVVTRVVVNAGKAIGAYERLLACGPGRFDRWMHGDASALSPSEQRGAVLFVGAGKCAGCHAGPFLSDQKFHNVGLAPMAVAAAFLDADDRGAAAGVAEATADELNTKGRYSDGDDGRLTAAVAPEGAFRTPTLRCVGQRPSFFHTGRRSPSRRWWSTSTTGATSGDSSGRRR